MDYEDYLSGLELDGGMEQRANEAALLADLKNDQIKIEEGDNYENSFAYKFNSKGGSELFGSL